MRSFTMCALLGLVLAGGLFAPPRARSASLELSPSEVLIVVNPANSGDVRFACRFTLPEGIVAAQVASASLRLPSNAVGTDALIVGRCPGDWGVLTTWETLTANNPAMRAAQFNSSTMQAAGKTLYDDPAAPDFGEYEFNLGDEVREGLMSGQGVGFWIGPVPGAGASVAHVLTPGVVPRLALLIEDSE